MAVRVLIVRRFQEGKASQVFALLKELRALAMNQTGYITGETLFSQEDPQKMVVIGTWESHEDWLAWRAIEARKQIEARLDELLIEPTRYEVFGYDHQFTGRHPAGTSKSETL